MPYEFHIACDVVVDGTRCPTRELCNQLPPGWSEVETNVPSTKVYREGMKSVICPLHALPTRHAIGSSTNDQEILSLVPPAEGRLMPRLHSIRVHCDGVPADAARCPATHEFLADEHGKIAEGPPPGWTYVKIGNDNGQALHLALCPSCAPSFRAEIDAARARIQAWDALHAAQAASAPPV